MKRFAIMVTMLILSACATNEKTTEKYWRKYGGKHIDEAIMRLGPASSVADLSSGGKVYTWSFEGQTRVHANRFGNQVFVNQHKPFCVLRLITDQNQKVRDLNWKGNSC